MFRLTRFMLRPLELNDRLHVCTIDLTEKFYRHGLQITWARGHVIQCLVLIQALFNFLPLVTWASTCGNTCQYDK